MSSKLLIVFAKNPELGKVKTRLAKTFGDQAAFDIYLKMMEITHRAISDLANCTIHIYCSNALCDKYWNGYTKFLQKGDDLGERMYYAFHHSFNSGFEKVICIGTDLPDITSEIIESGFNALDKADVVFGPAKDGGYYLIAMKRMIPEVFKNKPWSQSTLLNVTTEELDSLHIKWELLETLNDIDTIEDLRDSRLGKDY